MSYLMHLIPQAYERTTEFEPLSPLMIRPILPSLGGEVSSTPQGKKGRSLMPNSILESKVNQLYDLLAEIEEINAGDEDVEWCVGCMKDHAHTLSSIAEDYHHFRDAA